MFLDRNDELLAERLPRPISSFTLATPETFSRTTWTPIGAPRGNRPAHRPRTLVFSIGIGLTATVINPCAMSYGYDRLRFIRPVHIGDTITTITRIADKRDHPKRPARAW
jgi:acyl dehydratase